jgi:hypothetical protein
MAIIDGTALIFADVQRHRHRRLLACVAKSQPVLEAMESQREKQEQIVASFAKSPALEAVAKQHQETRGQILKTVGKQPALAAIAGQQREWQEQMLKAFKAPSGLSSLNSQQQERHRQLVASIGKSPAIEEAFRNWKVTLPPGLADQMANFQTGLLADIASSVPVGAVDDGSDEVWFGAESWSRLVWEMVTILKCAELTASGMVTAKYGLGAPIPSMVIYLLAMFIAAGELAAHLAEDAFEDAP